MELDFIPNVNEFGEHFCRLYNFEQEEAILFRNVLKDTMLNGQKELDLGDIDFIMPRNCNLILRVAEEDEGIMPGKMPTFYCNLTLKGWVELVDQLQPYCDRKTKGYKFLYDLDNPIDFVFSPGGTYEEPEPEEEQ